MHANSWPCRSPLDVLLQWGAHHPINHTQCFTSSHWMPQLGQCLHPIAIAPAAAKGINVIGVRLNTN